MYAVMSTFELSLDSIWFLCFSESALHQYYMPTLAEEGFFLWGMDNHRKYKHAGCKQQTFKTASLCVDEGKINRRFSSTIDIK